MLSAFLSTIAVFAADTAIALGGATLAPPVSTPLSTLVVAAPLPVSARIASNAVAAAPAPAGANAEIPPVFADLGDDAVAGEIMRYLESLTTLAGDFVQTAPTGAVVSGDFYLRRPGQIRFDYDDPSPITIVATGGMVYVENAELETTDSYPLKKTPLKFLLSKKIDVSDAALKSVDRAADRVALTYASTDEETEGEITLVFSAPTLAIEEWAIRDPQGGVTIVSLQGVTSGGKLENRLFRAPEAGGAFINN